MQLREVIENNGAEEIGVTLAGRNVKGLGEWDTRVFGDSRFQMEATVSPRAIRVQLDFPS